MTAARSAPVEWVVRQGSCPTRRPARSWRERVDAIAAGRRPRWCGCSSIRRSTPPAPAPSLPTCSSPGASRCTAPGAAASSPITGPASAWSTSCSTCTRRFGDVRAYVGALEALIIEALAMLGVEAHTRSGLVGVWVRRPEGGREREAQDRRHRRAAAALGEFARLQHQRGARPRALRRHRALRHPRRRGDEPRRLGSGAGMEAVDACAAPCCSSAASAAT